MSSPHLLPLLLLLKMAGVYDNQMRRAKGPSKDLASQRARAHATEFLAGLARSRVGAVSATAPETSQREFKDQIVEASTATHGKKARAREWSQMRMRYHDKSMLMMRYRSWPPSLGLTRMKYHDEPMMLMRYRTGRRL